MTNTVEKTILLNAPVERVWRAIAEPAQFGAWFGVKLDGAFAVGEVARGPLTLERYRHVTWEATITRMDSPRLFAFTWHPYAVDPAIDYSQETPTTVEFHLVPEAGGTRLTVIETGFDALPAQRRPDALRMNDSGWQKQLQNIADYVESQDRLKYG